MSRKCLRVIFPLIAVIFWTMACGPKLRGQVDLIVRDVRKARDQGAYKCAPKALALSEAHSIFSQVELDQGAMFRAEDHIIISRENAKIAVRDSVGCIKVIMDRDGDKIFDDVDQCPDNPEDYDGFQDVDGCPDLDNDSDGVPDAVDKCPMVPEDRDGYQDNDGCPDIDNDLDKIADVFDKCPNEAEDYDGDADEDGCWDKFKLIKVTGDRILLSQKVYFATARWNILPRSFPMMDEIVSAMQGMADLRVRIEGHTDDRGSDKYNKKLSDKRAASVRQYLVDHGIAGDRMVSVGHGEEKPMASNKTKEGREQNRRVEFHVLKNGQ